MEALKQGADAAKNGYELVRSIFLLTFATAIPAIIPGGIAERAKLWPQLMTTAVIDWNQHFGVQAWIKSTTEEEFHDFAGSIVVHTVGGWIALPAVILLGARSNRYREEGRYPRTRRPIFPFWRWARRYLAVWAASASPAS